MNAQIVTIGDEILIGKIVDTNSAWLGNELTLSGVKVQKVSSITDNEDDIKLALKKALEETDLVILTGGLGPTKDDITKKAIADFMGQEMYFEEALFDKIKAYFKRRGIPMVDAHRLQCFMPQGVRLLENQMGTAPGMLFEKEGKYILSMPGVPYEMKWIFDNSFKPVLKEMLPDGLYIYHKTIKTVGIGESRIAEMILDISDTLPSDISLSFLPSLGSVKIRLTKKSESNPKQEIDTYINRLTERLGSYVFGFNDLSLEEALLRDFSEKELTLAVAESCTGGLLSHKITSIPGSSKYFLGGVVSYANEVKENQLTVSKSTLINYGAVSEETVIEMLNGILNLMNPSVGIAISGVAGPGGGSKEKPVGTIWMAWGSKENQKTYKLSLAKDRLKNIEYATVFAMNQLRLFIKDL